jgi:hypothetical protein
MSFPQNVGLYDRLVDETERVIDEVRGHVDEEHEARGQTDVALRRTAGERER